MRGAAGREGRGGRDGGGRRGVLFDLDGTLLDPNGSIRQTIDQVLAERGLPGFAPHEVLIGMPLRDILRLRTRDEAAVEAMVQAYRRTFTGATWRLVRFYPGMRELVAGLRDAGVPTAVVTTKGEQEAQRLLSDLGCADLFRTVVGDDDVRPLKPDPAPVRAACDRLGLRPADCAMVGDTVYDVEAGRRAGCFTVGVLWGHGLAEQHGSAGADAVAREPAELARILDAWRGA